MYQREPSIHWRPNLPELRQEDSSSRSYLFSNLRYALLSAFNPRQNSTSTIHLRY
jgi:hypothetical protein